MKDSSAPQPEPTKNDAEEFLDQALIRHLTALRRDPEITDAEFTQAVTLARYVRDTWKN